MLLALVLASMTQFRVTVEQQAPVIIEQQAPVIYEIPTFQTTTFQTVLRTVPTVTYSLPEVSVFAVDPVVRVYSPFMGRRAVFKERGFGFRSRTVIRY